MAEKLGRGASVGKVQSVSKFANQSMTSEDGKTLPQLTKTGTAPGRSTSEVKHIVRFMHKKNPHIAVGV